MQTIVLWYTINYGMWHAQHTVIIICTKRRHFAAQMCSGHDKKLQRDNQEVRNKQMRLKMDSEI